MLETMGRKRERDLTGWPKRIEALITRFGEEKLIDILCTTPRALKGWRYGEWEPPPAHQKLIKLVEKAELK